MFGDSLRRSKSIKRIIQRSLFLSATVPLLLSVLGIYLYINSTFRDYIQENTISVNYLVVNRIEDSLNGLLTDINRATEIVNDAGLRVDDHCAYFLSLLSFNKDLSEIKILNKNGIVQLAIPDDPAVLGTDMSNYPAFKQATQTGQMYWSETFLSETTGVPSLSISVPIKEGVLLVDVILPSLEPFVLGLDLGRNTQVAIIDQTGTFIAHTDATKVRERQESPVFPLVNETIGVRPQAMNLNVNGEDLLISAAKIPSSGWLVTITQDMGELFAPIKLFGVVAIAIVAVLLFFTLSLLGRGFATVTRHMDKLVTKASEIARGKYDIALEKQNFSELDTISEAFVHMSTSVKKREAKVRQLNSDLQAKLHELTELHQLTNLILSSAVEGIYGLDTSGRIVFVNSAACSMLGYSKAELMGANHHALCHSKHPDGSSYPVSECPVHATLNDGNIRSGSEWFVHKSDMIVPVEFYSVPIQRDGKLAGAVVTVIDISKRKKAEDRAKESEQRYRVLFENSPIGMVYFNTTGEIVECNDTFAELMGAPTEQLIGFNSLLNSTPPMQEAIKKALSGEQSEYENTYTSIVGGKTTYLHAVFNPVILDGEISAVIATTEDVYERKLVEDTQRIAREQAEAASRTKSEFLANMSHEVRTPLNGIMGMIQLIKTTKLDSFQRDCADQALNSSERLTQLLADILDISRVEAGRLTLRSEPINLREMFDSLKLLFLPIAQQQKVALRFKVSSNVPEQVRGDSTRLQQILSNLIGNGVKFSSGGDVTVCIDSLATGSSAHSRLLFTVSDTGIGIAEDKIDFLFAPFTQGSEGYTREFQGAGLGLAITKQLVELMGGNMSVISEVSKGTTFYFSLEFEKELATESVGDKKQLLLKKTALNILLAEDDDITRLATSQLLERCGHSVTAAEDGSKALDILAKDTFDLVLMDIQMPVVNGIEATEAIRRGAAGESNKAIPIVAITAYAMVDDRDKFLQAGMTDYLPKPIGIDALEVVLERLMDNQDESTCVEV
ncbi:MAG: PAS domain S-box protein [Desulfovibrio sp.]